MNKPSIKSRLNQGERLSGCWIGMYNIIASEIVANAGYDIMFIDLEHGPGTYMDALNVMQSAKGSHCASMIRVPSADIVDIKRTLDLGPAGIMVPNIRTADEARQIVSACRYGPEGVRGAAPRIIRASGYGDNVKAYLEFMQHDFLLIVQIESVEAVDQIDEIAEVEGIDMIFIGPSDLSASMGAMGQYDRPEFIEAFETIEKSTLKAGKFLGCIPLPQWQPERLYRNGHSLVLSGTDTMLLKQAALNDVEELEKAKQSVSES